MIKPPHAPTIWSTPTTIYLEFPSPVSAKTHQVEIPHTTDGLALALMVIQSREEKPTVGTKAAPTQYMTELALKKTKIPVKRIEKVKMTDGQRGNLKSVLRELGMI